MSFFGFLVFQLFVCVCETIGSFLKARSCAKKMVPIFVTYVYFCSVNHSSTLFICCIYVCVLFVYYILFTVYINASFWILYI